MIKRKQIMSSALATSAIFLLSKANAIAQAPVIPTLLPVEDVNIKGGETICIGLGQLIQSGDIHLRHLPCFIAYFTQTLIGVAGSLAVVFVMFGGYLYVVGGEEKKDAAKKTITYALIGLSVSLLAWIIVSLVLQIATE